MPIVVDFIHLSHHGQVPEWKYFISAEPIIQDSGVLYHIGELGWTDELLRRTLGKLARIFFIELL